MSFVEKLFHSLVTFLELVIIIYFGIICKTISGKEKKWAKINKNYYSFEMKENCVDFIENNNQNFVKKSSFFRFWNKYKQDIRVMTPRTDVCLICKNSLIAIMKVSVDQGDNELIKAYVKHRPLAKNQRNYFNEKKK
jgi:hypothetical protein